MHLSCLLVLQCVCLQTRQWRQTYWKLEIGRGEYSIRGANLINCRVGKVWTRDMVWIQTCFKACKIFCTLVYFSEFYTRDHYKIKNNDNRRASKGVLEFDSWSGQRLCVWLSVEWHPRYRRNYCGKLWMWRCYFLKKHCFNSEGRYCEETC